MQGRGISAKLVCFFHAWKWTGKVCRVGQSISRLCPHPLLPSRPGKLVSKGLVGEDVYLYDLKGEVALLAANQICTI